MKRGFRITAELRRRRIETLVVLPQGAQSFSSLKLLQACALAAGVRRVIGVRRQDAPLKQVLRNDRPGMMYEHVAQVFLRVVDPSQRLDIEQPSREFCLVRNADAERQAADLLREGLRPSERGLACFAVGSRMPAKLWPVERFAEIVRRLTDQAGMNIIMVGAAEDRERSQQVVKAGPPRAVLDLTGQTSLRQLVAFLRQCRLYVGNDTGVMHVAYAAGVPCVAVFSSRDLPGRWFPLGAGSRAFYSDVPCRGCLLKECVEKDTMCIKQIGVDAVWDAIQGILDRGWDALETRPA